jgi:hypothetical protein
MPNALRPQTYHVRALSKVTDVGGRIRVIAEEIARYLEDHPDAADTLDGIQEWWLFRQRLDESLDGVSKAVEYLLKEGRIARRQASDGTTVFVRCAGKKKGPSAC